MAGKYKAPELRPHYIKPWLIALGVSQEELARRMGTEPNNVTRWINEPWRVTLDVLSGVSIALSFSDHSVLLQPPTKARLAEHDIRWLQMTDAQRERAIRLLHASEG